jgi:hypothetical protein
MDTVQEPTAPDAAGSAAPPTRRPRKPVAAQPAGPTLRPGFLVSKPLTPAQRYWLAARCLFSEHICPRDRVPQPFVSAEVLILPILTCMALRPHLLLEQHTYWGSKVRTVLPPSTVKRAISVGIIRLERPS